MSEVTIWECSEQATESMPVDDLIAKLIDARDRAPKGKVPVVEFWCAGDYARAYIEVLYRQPIAPAAAPEKESGRCQVAAIEPRTLGG